MGYWERTLRAPLAHSDALALDSPESLCGLLEKREAETGLRIDRRQCRTFRQGPVSAVPCDLAWLSDAATRLRSLETAAWSFAIFWSRAPYALP